jgi:Domain of unknown function (DUF6531)
VGPLRRFVVVVGVRSWLAGNETDAQWVTTIAQAFRDAGAGTVPDAAIDARLRDAGLAGTRVSVTYDDPVALGEPPTSGYADDPVNTATGNFVEAEIDLVAGGLSRLLGFERTYNSRSDRVGPFGPGWASWASARLRAEPGGAHWEAPDGQRAVIPRAGDAGDCAGYARLASSGSGAAGSRSTGRAARCSRRTVLAPRCASAMTATGWSGSATAGARH